MLFKGRGTLFKGGCYSRKYGIYFHMISRSFQIPESDIKYVIKSDIMFDISINTTTYVHGSGISTLKGMCHSHICNGVLNGATIYIVLLFGQLNFLINIPPALKTVIV